MELLALDHLESVVVLSSYDRACWRSDPCFCLNSPLRNEHSCRGCTASSSFFFFGAHNVGSKQAQLEASRKEKVEAKMRTAVYAMLDTGMPKMHIRKKFAGQLSVAALSLLFKRYKEDEADRSGSRAARPRSLAKRLQLQEDTVKSRASTTKRATAATPKPTKKAGTTATPKPSKLSSKLGITAAKPTKAATRHATKAEATTQRLAEAFNPSNKPSNKKFTALNQLQRISYAECMLATGSTNWHKRVVWSGETCIPLSYKDRHGYWTTPDAPPRMIVYEDKGNLWLWGGVSWRGTTELLVLEVPGTNGFNAEVYQKQVLAKIKGKLPFGMTLMEDNAPSHAAQSNSDYRAANGIRTFPSQCAWPTNSSDLNPIDYLWAHLKSEIWTKKGAYKSKANMIKACQEIWAEIDLKFCQNLVDMIPLRLEIVLATGGGSSNPRTRAFKLKL
jgi:hypothetical protein